MPKAETSIYGNVLPFPSRDPLKISAAAVAPYIAELAETAKSPIRIAAKLLVLAAERADDPSCVWPNLNSIVGAFLLLAHELGIEGIAEEIASRPLCGEGRTNG